MVTMKVAFATNDAKHVNSHFGFCEKFAVYEVTHGKYVELPARQVVIEQNMEESGRIEARVNAVKDCTLLFITQIGPAAAARVTRNKIMPIKVEEGTTIEQQLNRIMDMLKNKPPVWLTKALNESDLMGEMI